MKKDLTELVFILDKSGSMGGMEADTIGGYNSLLSKQKAVTGEAVITTVLFDQDIHLLHDRINLQAVSALGDHDYQVGGSTALLDAVGLTIDKIGNAIKHTDDASRPEKVMVVIITDGEENASRLYSAERVKSMISRQMNKYGWEFIFLGANIDAVKTAGNYGIDPSRAQDYHNDKGGIELNFSVMSDAITHVRSAKSLDEDWNRKIDKDYKNRKR
jgi:uncharacterized protein YegL